MGMSNARYYGNTFTDDEAAEIIDQVRRKANILRYKVSQSKAIIYAHGLKPFPIDEESIEKIKQGNSSTLARKFDRYGYLEFPYAPKSVSWILSGVFTLALFLPIGWTALFYFLEQIQEYFSENPWARNTLVIGSAAATTAISTYAGLLCANRAHILKGQRSVSPLIKEVFISETQLLELDDLIRRYESLG